MSQKLESTIAVMPDRRNLLQRAAGPYIGVKPGKPQCEHMVSALPGNRRADIQPATAPNLQSVIHESFDALNFAEFR